MPGDFQHSSAKPHGTLIVSPEFGGTITIDTHMCCHCGGHFTVVKGSGKRRGFCMKCMHVTCGAPGCDPCVPVEKRLDLYEKGKISTI